MNRCIRCPVHDSLVGRTTRRDRPGPARCGRARADQAAEPSDRGPTRRLTSTPTPFGGQWWAGAALSIDSWQDASCARNRNRCRCRSGRRAGVDGLLDPGAEAPGDGRGDGRRRRSSRELRGSPSAGEKRLPPGAQHSLGPDAPVRDARRLGDRQDPGTLRRADTAGEHDHRQGRSARLHRRLSGGHGRAPAHGGGTRAAAAAQPR